MRAPARLLRHLLARLLQLRHQPLHLRGILQGLPVGRINIVNLELHLDDTPNFKFGSFIVFLRRKLS